MTDTDGDVANHLEGDPETAVQIGGVQGDVYVNSHVYKTEPPSLPPPPGRLHVLAVDDEPHGLGEIVYLLRANPHVMKVDGVSDGITASQYIHYVLRRKEPLDAVFMDIEMPGLNGLDLARLVARFAVPPSLVFVTAWDEHAVEAFELDAVDYLLKPVHPDRLADTVRKLLVRAAPHDRGASPADPVISVERAGVTGFVRLSEVHLVELDGRRAHLHTSAGEFTARVPAPVVAADWDAAGFVRIDECHLVARRYVEDTTRS
jgi:DNA-binding LytR/AlgR family response regulator